MRTLILLLICAFNVAQAEEFSARIIIVIDGDTVVIRRTQGLVKIRLAEIDAPEVSHAGMSGPQPNLQQAQDFGEASKKSLSDMVLGKQVNVLTQAVDKYGRLVAYLNINGLDVNAEQIRRGMAWAAVGWRKSHKAPTGVPLEGAYSNYTSSAVSRPPLRDPLHSNKELLELQKEAQKASLGLWAQNNPTPPWEWRKQHPNTWAVQSSVEVSSSTSLNASCGKKRLCSEMASCDEAKYYFSICGINSLDANRNRVPCETLCGVKGH